MRSAEAEFAALFEEQYGRVLRYAQRRITDAEVACELANECFAIAWAKFDPAHPITLPWLFQTARHLLANEYRRSARSKDAMRWMAELSVTGPELDDLIEVSMALDRLSDDDRELVRLTYWEGLSAVEAGRTLGLSDGAVKVRLTRARARLRELLEGRRAVTIRRGSAREVG